MFWPLIGGFIAFVLFAIFMGWIMDDRRATATATATEPHRPGARRHSVAAPRPRRSARAAIHSAPAVSVSPWAMIEQNTVSAARLKIVEPAAIGWLRTSSEKVIVATPLGPNHDMNARVAVSVCGADQRREHRHRARHQQRHGHHADRGPPGSEQAVQGQQRAEDDEDPRA